ncbi:MAG TPA: glycerate kinase [Spirosoma sp.]|nr:glycerate kinase [Spirosoma sp.]
MRVILAPDKFRGSLTALQVTKAMEEGVRQVWPDAELVALPLADGGEGTAQVLTEATSGTWHTAVVSDPLGRPVEAGFGLSGDGHTAFIEMAAASGLALLTHNERRTLQTSTVGTGELIRYAINLGVSHIVLAIGGSATTDAGIGMASALGWKFLDGRGKSLRAIGQSLPRLSRIIAPAVSNLSSITFSVACDVTNPLYGTSGAAYVYGPQKGATARELQWADMGLRRFADVVQEQYTVDVANRAGAGAAGGLGAGALFFLNATLRPGVDVVLDAVDFDRHVRQANLVLTGEGKLDRQTLQGKVLKGVADRGRLAHVPVVALCGTLDLGPADIDALGLTAAFSVLNRPQLLDEAILTADADVRAATFNVCRLLRNVARQ